MTPDPMFHHEKSGLAEFLDNHNVTHVVIRGAYPPMSLWDRIVLWGSILAVASGVCYWLLQAAIAAVERKFQ